MASRPDGRDGRGAPDDLNLTPTQARALAAALITAADDLESTPVPA